VKHRTNRWRVGALVSVLATAGIGIAAAAPAVANPPAAGSGAVRGAAKAGLIGPSSKLVGTYNVSVHLPSAFGGAVLTGQLTLAGDGTWTGNALSGRGCGTDSGSWLSSGKVLALSDITKTCGTHGMTWMVNVGKHNALGSVKAPGYLNCPYAFNAGWDATAAPMVPATPEASSKIGPSAKLVGSYSGGVTYQSYTYTTTFTINQDGTWTESEFCIDGGSWLADGSTIALSDIGSSACQNKVGMSWMAPVGKGLSFGSSKKPGDVSDPGIFNATWFATHT
jgi:hypothetical protein